MYDAWDKLVYQLLWVIGQPVAVSPMLIKLSRGCAWGKGQYCLAWHYAGLLRSAC